MSLHTELDFTGVPDYIDAAPTALPEGLGGFEPLQLDQVSGPAEIADSVKLDIGLQSAHIISGVKVPKHKSKEEKP